MDLLINILLTVLGYIPGIIHALYIVSIRLGDMPELRSARASLGRALGEPRAQEQQRL